MISPQDLALLPSGPLPKGSKSRGISDLSSQHWGAWNPDRIILHGKGSFKGFHNRACLGLASAYAYINGIKYANITHIPDISRIWRNQPYFSCFCLLFFYVRVKIRPYSRKIRSHFSPDINTWHKNCKHMHKVHKRKHKHNKMYLRFAICLRFSLRTIKNQTLFCVICTK